MDCVIHEGSKTVGHDWAIWEWLSLSLFTHFQRSREPVEQRLPVFLRSLWNEWLFLWLISAKALSWCALGTDKPDPSLPPPAELVYQYSSLRHTLDLLGQSALNSDVNFCCPLKQFYYFSFQLSFETRGDENKSIFTEWKNKINRNQNYFCNLSGKNCEQYHGGINNLTISVLTPWRDLMISEMGALLIYHVCCEFHMGKVKRNTTDLVLIMWHWFYKGPQVSVIMESVYWLPLWGEEKLQCIQQEWTQHCNSKQNCSVGTSLVVQWLRLHLPMQGAWIRSLIPDWGVKIPHASGCGWKKHPAL